MKNTELLAKILGLLLLILGLFITQDVPSYEWIIFTLLMLAVGIPHGAIDHLTSNPKVEISSLVPFLFKYLGLIVCYLLVWWLTPTVALAGFILMSSYHFGQTHFLKSNPDFPWGFLLFCSRGLLFIFLILWGNFGETQRILLGVVDISGMENYASIGFMSLLFITVGLQYGAGVSFTKMDLLDLVLLAPLLYSSSLLLGFVIYFGLWHAWPSMLAEYRYLKNFESFSSPIGFIRHLIPFTLLSLIGISLVLYIGQSYLDFNQLVFVFFVMISLISFPHIFYMDDFIKKI